VSVRDFSSDRYILLGNPFSTPWVDLFEDRLNFHSVRDGDGVGFLNRSRRADELARYSVPDAAKEGGSGYARVALVPNTSGNGAVLLLGGVNMVTMEAAGQFIADPSAVPGLMTRLGIQSLSQMPFFELILETQGVDNAPQKAHIVASRVISVRK
jgi:hypothetical protein